MVFGASGGIGSALSHRLAKHEGASLVLVGRDENKLASLQSSLPATGSVNTLTADVTDAKQVERTHANSILVLMYQHQSTSSGYLASNC